MSSAERGLDLQSKVVNRNAAVRYHTDMMLHSIPSQAVSALLCGAILVLAGTGARAEDSSALNAWRHSVETNAMALIPGAKPVRLASADTQSVARSLAGFLAAAAAPMSGGRVSPPALRFRSASGDVWGIADTGLGGATVYELSARRSRDFKPLCFLATGLPPDADADFDAASALVKSLVLAGRAQNVALDGLEELCVVGQTRLTTWGHCDVAAPWGACWVFFVDDDPSANWEHPCRYVFVARDLSAVAVQYAMTPLSVARADGRALEMETVIPFLPPVEKKPAALRRATAPRPALNFGEGGSNYYAVLISGGVSTNSNADRFWRDTAFFYYTLVHKYGYPKSNLYVLVADGTSPAIDHLNFNYTPPDSYLASTPVDFDNDGEPDITGEASPVNISNAFIELQARLTPQDQLLVFTTDHGAQTAGGGSWDAEICLWNGGRFRDVELKALTTNLPCTVLFVMEQCYSGGFLDDLNQSNRVIATAAPNDGVSRAGTYPYYYDQWCYYWAAAMRGCFASNYVPWQDGAPCDADRNGDGYVSFQEASQFADEHKPEGDWPMYQEAPSLLGRQIFLTRVPEETLRNSFDHFLFGGIRSPEQQDHPVPFQIAAVNVFNEIMTNFAGPVVLEPQVDEIDPGLYVGRGTIEWSSPINPSMYTERAQVIYPAAQMGGARQIGDLALRAAGLPTMPLMDWTIRMKHTTLSAYPTNAEWESTGWTIVYQSNETITNTGWVTFVFTNTFDYNGTDNLMVDFSFHAPSNAYGALCEASESDQERTLVYEAYADWSSYDVPMNWSGTSNPTPERTKTFPNIRIGPPPYPAFVGVDPSNLTGFADGVWTGSLQFSNTTPRMRVQMYGTNRHWSGVSDEFAVKDYLFDVAAPQVGDDGTCLVQWGSGPGAKYRILASTNPLAGFEILATNLAATPPMNTYTAAVGTTARRLFSVQEE